MASRNETRVAVFLGGRSPEHDVSVITGLQALKAIDQERFVPFPVYVNPRGQWFVGDVLAERRNYLPDARIPGELTQVSLSLGEAARGLLVPKRSGLFGRRAATEFDVALLAFHGFGGEDGQMQGLFETANLPYTGMRTLASAVFMDKAATKRLLRGLDIPLLPDAVVTRGAAGLPSADALSALLGNMGFPCIVKPAHLGSSIGVGKADSLEEVRALLPMIFRLDSQALIEPFVANLVEYNLAVMRVGGTVRTSAIERPKRAEELFDFRQKYLSGGNGDGGKTGIKGDAGNSQGMLSLTRDINPELPAGLASRFAALGDPRVRGGRRHRRAARRFLLQRGDRRDLAQRGQPVPGLVRLFPVGSGRAADRVHRAIVAADRRGAGAPSRRPAAR